MKSKFLRLIFFLLILNLFIGCVADDAQKASSGTTAPPAGEETTSLAPLALRISTTYSGTSTEEYQTFTETGTRVCEATTSNKVVTCSIVVPEGRLYFSDLNFHMSWQISNCKLLEFQPYYYLASKNAAFTPAWGTSTVNCSVVPYAKDCYGGAAPQIVDDFPNFLGMIYFPDEGSTEEYLTQTETIASAYSLKYQSNRLTSNDLATSKQSSDQTVEIAGDGYSANNFVTYRYSCRDDWFDPVTYQITVNITDEDSNTGGPVNTFKTWREIP